MSRLLIKQYTFPLALIAAIVGGATIGYFFNSQALMLKPIADIYLNLIYCVMVPLIFFSLATAMIELEQSRDRQKHLFGNIILTFLFTSITAALFMLIVVKIFPPNASIIMSESLASKATHSLGEQLVKTLSAPNFAALLTHQYMLPLILFALFTGIATAQTKEQSTHFADWLKGGANVFTRLTEIIMYAAPLGFFAYFAVFVSQLGPEIISNYFYIAISYYMAAIAYALCAFTAFAYLADKKQGVNNFWRASIVPGMTSFATCSSIASIPATLEGARKLQIPSHLAKVIIPIGALLHKDGSVLGGVLKIAFLFGLFHWDFFGLNVFLSAIAVSMLVGSVMGAIPSGGMLGELLILALYGFPPQSLMLIAAISVIIDPIATVINVLTNLACGMMLTKISLNKKITEYDGALEKNV